MGPTSNAKKEKKYPMPSGSHRVCNVDKPPNPGEDLLLSFRVHACKNGMTPLADFRRIIVGRRVEASGMAPNVALRQEKNTIPKFLRSS